MSAWLRPWWLLGHLVIGVIAAVCLRLGWWQWEHALRGDGRSLGYALQWPLFAAFGVFFWTRVVRERLSRVAGSSGPPTTAPTVSVGQSWLFRRGDTDAGPVPQLTPTVEAARQDEDDPAAAAYMHRLRWLNADPRRRLSDYPGFDDR
ncbi:hypothetical protein [Micromonospora sp. WMMD1155]|uniref:hypothetical protein n=1 Tax=Micromonospora sp. WMMD1155 TaxID=3016094 RepID=UPI00249B1B7C|nr:hypothetical protein [Micromonospora sp. WMMD1155]WFE53070.1 hypothetical protein O7617_23340 [Micromonospora sp. WMMD1155]